MSIFDSLINPYFKEKYEGGLPNFEGPKDVWITFKQKEGLIILKSVDLIFSKKFEFKPNQIVEIGLDQNSYRHSGKMVAGAIIGGVLTGGIGLLAGAAMGGKRRKESTLSWVVNLDGFEHTIFIKSSKTTQKLYTEFINFLAKFPKNLETDESKELQQDLVVAQVDPIAQIEKLHSLMEKGIITEAEFKEQKEKLLSQ